MVYVNQREKKRILFHKETRDMYLPDFYELLTKFPDTIRDFIIPSVMYKVYTIPMVIELAKLLEQKKNNLLDIQEVNKIFMHLLDASINKIYDAIALYFKKNRNDLFLIFLSNEVILDKKQCNRLHKKFKKKKKKIIKPNLVSETSPDEAAQTGQEELSIENPIQNVKVPEIGIYNFNLFKDKIFNGSDEQLKIIIDNLKIDWRNVFK